MLFNQSIQKAAIALRVAFPPSQRAVAFKSNNYFNPGVKNRYEKHIK
jgi:hypothetical protein